MKAALLFLFLVCAARGLSQAPPPRNIKLNLTRLDSSPAGKFSYAHLQEALRRTSLRLVRFQYLLQFHGGGAGAGLSTHPRHRRPDNAHSSSYRTPVFGDISGDFLTTLSIGTPPVSFNAFVDTGSDLVWVQCQPCFFCFTSTGHNTIFDPSQSSSYSVLPCASTFCNDVFLNECVSTGCVYGYPYADRSFTVGYLSLETLTLPDLSGAAQQTASFVFGCGRYNNFTFKTGAADGVVGLGLGPLSLPSQLGVSSLSYCLQSITNPASKISSLYLGEVEQPPLSSNGPTLRTPFFKHPKISGSVIPLYYVNLTGISVGKELVMASANGAFDIQKDGTGGIVIDSGSTITSLKSEVYNAIVEAFTSAIALPPASTTPSLCYVLSSASNMQFPSLTFHFEGADLQLPLHNYFTAHKNDNLICLALAPSQSISIFGNLQQQNFFITFDLQAHTLSFTPTTCA